MYVEGAFRVWLRGCQVTYFTIRGQARPKRPKHSEHHIWKHAEHYIWQKGELRRGADRPSCPGMKQKKQGVATFTQDTEHYIWKKTFDFGTCGTLHLTTGLVLYLGIYSTLYLEYHYIWKHVAEYY